MSVSVIEKNGLPYVQLLHPSNLSSAEVCLYGATVTSFATQLPGASTRTENLFVSKKAVLDGSKAIRGGVPLVFPQVRSLRCTIALLHACTAVPFGQQSINHSHACMRMKDNIY
jgi:hypothetical protein